MSISFVHLRRVLFGTSCAVVFGFGAAQALASSPSPGATTCSDGGEQACDDYCASIWGGAVGSCTDQGGMYTCECGIVVDDPGGQPGTSE